MYLPAEIKTSRNGTRDILGFILLQISLEKLDIILKQTKNKVKKLYIIEKSLSNDDIYTDFLNIFFKNVSWNSPKPRSKKTQKSKISCKVSSFL